MASSKPLGFVFLEQGITPGRHNAIGFNTYPDNTPRLPYFTERWGYEIREVFVRYLVTAPRLERCWPGKGCYRAAQRWQHAREQNTSMSLHHAEKNYIGNLW